MKRIEFQLKWLLVSVVIPMIWGCSGQDEQPPVPSTDSEWKVTLSRTVTNNEHVLVSLEYGGTTKYGELVPAYEENGKATWVEGKKIDWPSQETGTITMKAFSPVPSEGNTLPADVSADPQVAYLVAYEQVENGNQSIGIFTLQHLMAQLQVHINLTDKGKHHYQPQNATIRLHQSGTVDYSRKELIPAGEAVTVSLGDFSKEGESTETTDNWKNTPQIVVPQTLPKDVLCISFTTDDGMTYTFTPDETIRLYAGRVNHIYLGVAAQQPDTYLSLQGITVGDWADGGTLSGGEAEEQ